MTPRRLGQAVRGWMLLVVVASGSLPVAAQASEASQSLQAFLRDLQAAGLPIVFSETLVRPEMRATVAVRPGSARQRLQDVLAPWGLTVQPGRGGRWLVIQARSRPLPAARPSPDAPRQPVLSEIVEVLEPAVLTASAPPLSRSAADVQRTAGAFEDVFRALALLPGVTPVNEAQGRFSVRSGAPDQNLTIVDGVETHNPFRAEALVSALNPDTVESFELTTGVMPARFGDRLASVLEIRTRPGRREHLLQGSASVDAASAALTLEGPLPGNPMASWIVAGRHDTPGKLMKRLTHMGALGFEDLYLRVDWPWHDRVHASFWTLQGRERTRDWVILHDEVPDVLTADRRLDYRTRNDTWAATLHAALTPRLSTTTLLSRDANRQAAAEIQMIQPWQTEWKEVQQRQVRVADLALRQTAVFQVGSAQRWEAGVELHGLDTAWTMNGYGLLLGEWSLFRGPSLAPTTWGARGAFRNGSEVEVDSARDVSRVASWLQTAVAIAPSLIVEPALRMERSSINGETMILPRLQMAWHRGRTRLTAGWGLHAQSPGFEKLLLADAFLDYGGSDRLAVASERSQHAVVGVMRELGARTAARVELFHTRFDRLIVGRLQPAAPKQGLAELITAIPVNGGAGWVHGAELSLRFGPSRSTFRSPAGTLTYSYEVSRRESYGLVYPFDYDRRHALSLALELPVGRALTLAAAWRAASGLPYTPFEVELRPDDHIALATRLQDLNSARHPFYSRLDVRATFARGGPRHHFELYLDVFNVLDRDILAENNGPGFRPALAPEGDGWEVVQALPGPAIVPTFGARWRF